MAETPTGGLQIIREAVLARKSVMAMMARDCALSIDLLDAFANGRAALPPDNLDLVVEFCWNGHIEYNSDADALQPVPQPEPRSLGVPPTWSIDLPKYQRGPLQRSGPQPVVAPPVKPKQRAGWIGGVWE